MAKKRPYHQAKAPVDPAGHKRDHRHQDDGAAGVPGLASKPRQGTFDRWRIGEHETGDQYQQHLHREGQQVPEAVAPEAQHFKRRLTLYRNGRHGGNQRQQQHEDIRIRQVAFDQLDRWPRDKLEHEHGLLVSTKK